MNTNKRRVRRHTDTRDAGHRTMQPFGETLVLIIAVVLVGFECVDLQRLFDQRDQVLWWAGELQKWMLPVRERERVSSLRASKQASKQTRASASASAKYLKQLARTRALVGIHTRTLVNKIFEQVRELVGLLEWAAAFGGDQEQRLDGRLLHVRRLTFDHLLRHDTEAPDVDLGSVLLRSNDLGCHPVRGADDACALGLGGRQLRSEPKVGCDWAASWSAQEAEREREREATYLF